MENNERKMGKKQRKYKGFSLTTSKIETIKLTKQEKREWYKLPMSVVKKTTDFIEITRITKEYHDMIEYVNKYGILIIISSLKDTFYRYWFNKK